jgi:iron complex transport system ATP-binding protein
MPLLSVDHVQVELDAQTILHGVDFRVPAGRWIGLLGPNGSGKTTLLRAIGGLIPFEGQIVLDGRPVDAFSARERARRLAFVRQAPSLSFDFTVEELVVLGRAPHRGWLESYQGEDRSRVRSALSRVDLDGFAHRSVLSLSGGELQRVFLAQALVQEADLLLLDEPTSHLDVHYQFSFMEQVRSLVREGRTVITVFHDLELAARYAERLLVLQDGHLVAEGTPASVLTPSSIADVFGMNARVDRSADGELRIEYLGPIGTTVTAQSDPAGPQESGTDGSLAF